MIIVGTKNVLQSDSQIFKGLTSHCKMGASLGKRGQFMEPTTGINDLPIEIQLQIFENLSLHDLVDNCSRTCLQWR